MRREDQYPPHPTSTGSDRCPATRLYEAADQDAFLSQVGHNIRGVVTGGAKGLPNAIMNRLPALQVIAISGIGTDAVDLANAADRGVQVTTTPGVLTDDVADMAWVC